MSKTVLDNVRVRVLPPEILGEPEVKAMVMAMFSRSNMPIDERLAELGSDMSAMKQKLEGVVVGYGHASVLDMADVGVVIERIPILAAVAIENHALFAGQETSTRYVDWSVGEFVNPIPEEHEQLYVAMDQLHGFLRNTYVKVAEGVRKRLVTAAPSFAEDPVHKRAMSARSFDVARGFLPAGAVTSVGWTGRLSSMLQHLRALYIHPDPIIRGVAKKVHVALHEAFPGVVKADLKPEPESLEFAYWPNATPQGETPVRVEFSGSSLHLASSFLANRNRGERVPPRLANLQRLTIEGAIDYGSFRDLNRHRVGYKEVFPPNPSSRFHPWYLDMARDFLEPTWMLEYQSFVERIDDALRDLHDVPGFDYYNSREHMRAYAAPLGILVPVNYQMDVGQYTYLAELRTKPEVHPTLREFTLDAHSAAIKFSSESWIPFPIYVNYTPDPGSDGYVIVRGSQTILMKDGREIR